MKSNYRRLKYELDSKAGKGEEYKNVMEEFKMIKTDIDTLVEMGDKNREQDVLAVSCEKMIEFVSRKNVIGIVFFYAGEYHGLREGDSSKSLHAMCIWNGSITGYVKEEFKYERSYKEARMFSCQETLPSENREDILKRRKNEKEFLEKAGEFISSILDDLKTRNPKCDLPNRLMIVPHYILSKVPFCAVPVRTRFDGYNGREPRFLGDVFRGGIWMVPSMSIAVRIDKKKKRENAKKLEDCKIVSATCPSVVLQHQYNKTVREEIGRKVKNHVHIEEPYPPRTKIRGNNDLTDCDILHLTCHGVFAGDEISSAILNPSKVLSGSTLSFSSNEKNIANEDEEDLTKLNMVDIWGLDLKQCNLANVVACSGAAVDTLSRSDESLSIGTGFLVGGARNVICCAWPVQEIVAAIMMDRFYKNMCRSRDEENGIWKIGEHLGEAQRWLRELKGDDLWNILDKFDPGGDTEGIDVNEVYSWGAFMLVGPPN